MRKLIFGNSPKKKWHMDSFGLVERLGPTSPEYLKPKKTREVRRVHVLNSVILQTVCDVMSTGELSPELTDLGLEITRVKINSDFTSVNVYWTTSIAENTGELESILPPYAGRLKNIMCGLHVMGSVPYVTFVKDRHRQNVQDVVYALSRADFGPDFEPSDKTIRNKSTAIIQEQTSELQTEDETREQPRPPTEPLIATSTTHPPEMRMDIFHLNHREITEQIVRNMNSAKAAHRKAGREDHEGGDRHVAIVTRSKMPDTDADLRKLLKRNTKRKSTETRNNKLVTAVYRSDEQNEIADDGDPEIEDEGDYYDDDDEEEHGAREYVGDQSEDK